MLISNLSLFQYGWLWKSVNTTAQIILGLSYNEDSFYSIGMSSTGTSAILAIQNKIANYFEIIGNNVVNDKVFWITLGY